MTNEHLNFTLFINFLKENDAFAAKVNVSGATSYSTIGNKTTVPTFAIRDFVKIGSC